MAAVKAKKPVSKKLKAGKKKKVNKWLIVGGVVAVAIIGAAVVRFSSASSWVSIKKSTFSERELTPGSSLATGTVTLTAGHSYRFCARGLGFNKSQNSARLSFKIMDLNGKNPRDRYASTQYYGAMKQELHCSKSFYATKSYRAYGQIQNTGSDRPYNGIYLYAMSIDYLR